MPSTDFNFVANNDTPSKTFNFLPKAHFSIELESTTAEFLAQQATSSRFHQTIDDSDAIFNSEIAFQKITFDHTSDNAIATFNGVVALQAFFKLPVFFYQPQSLFLFESIGYKTSFTFNLKVDDIGRLEDTQAIFGVHYSDNRSQFHQTVDNTSAAFATRYVQNRASFKTDLDDVANDIVAVNAPRGSFSEHLDSVVAAFPTKYIQNRGRFAETLDNVSADISAVNAPQGVLAEILDDVNGQFNTVNAPQATLDIALENVGHNFTANSVDNVAQVNLTLEDTTGLFSSEFDYNVHRFTLSQTHSSTNNTQSDSVKVASIRQSTQPIIIQNANQQSATTVKNSSHKIITNCAVPLPKSSHSKAEQTEPLHKKTASIIDVLKKQHQSVASISQKTEKRNAKTTGILQQMTPLGNSGIHAVLQDSSTSIKIERHIRIIDDPNPYTPTTDIVLDSVEPMDGQFNFTVNQGSIEFIQQQFSGLLFSKVNSAWQIATPHASRTCHPVDPTRHPPPGTSLWIGTPPPDPDPEPNPTPQIVIPDQDSYFMQHLFNVTLLDTTPIRFKNINVSWNADSFAWSFTGSSLDKDDLPLIKQVGLTPIQLIATINGESWFIVIDKITRGRSFGKSDITVTGNGLSILLGHPHLLASSATQGGDLTVQQIADLQMPLGWSINWTAPTWLIPGGAYSHQNKTPIQAIAGIAQNIGAMIVPDRVNQVLNIMPRYPIKPWNFATATPDVIIPEAVITSVSEPSIVQSPINGVYVHGNEIGGQLAFCRFNGTAGDKLANTISNNLMTDPTGLRALGERILAAESTQPAIESMTMPMGGVVPLIEPGKFIKTTLAGVDIFGVVNSISINAEFAKVRQTIQIGEKTNNSWSLFKNLLPADPLLVGTLSSTDGSTSIITLLDGGVVRVRGTGVVSQKYYIRAGKIDGSAPNMTQSDIVI